MKRFFSELLRTIKAGGFLFILFLAACFTHNMDRGSYVYVSLIAVASIRFLFFPIKRYWDKTAFFLFLFSFLYVVFSWFSHSISFVDVYRLLLGPVVFYIYGRYIVSRCNCNPSSIRMIILLMIISISFPVWWAVIGNILAGNIVSTTSAEGARWITTWGQSKMAAATTYGLIASFGFCGVFFFIFSQNRFKNLDSWLLLAGSICSILTTTYLINRAGIVILGVGTVIAVLYTFRGLHLKSSFVILFILLLFVIIVSKWGGISEVFQAYSDRAGNLSTGGDRTWRWLDALQKLFTRPLGWSNDIQLGYVFVHNMWLDVARVAGILPFLALVVSTYYSVQTNFVLFKEKNNDLCLLLISLFSAVFLAYMVEPVIEANAFYLLIFTWIWGVEYEVAYGCAKQRS